MYGLTCYYLPIGFIHARFPRNMSSPTGENLGNSLVIAESCKMSFARCICFLQSNVFLPKFGIHVSYLNDSQFLKCYKNILSNMGCKDTRDLKRVQEEVIFAFLLNKISSCSFF